MALIMPENGNSNDDLALRIVAYFPKPFEFFAIYTSISYFLFIAGACFGKIFEYSVLGISCPAVVFTAFLLITLGNFRAGLVVMVGRLLALIVVYLPIAAYATWYWLSLNR